MSQTRRLTVDVEFPDGADPATVHAALIDHLNEVAYVSNDHGFTPLSVIAQQQSLTVRPPHPLTQIGRQ